MLDVKKEIKKLLNLNFNEQMRVKGSELTNIIKEYNMNMNKIGKTQFKYSSQMDEIMSMLDNIENDKQTMNDYRREIKSIQKDNAKMFSAVLKASDMMEDAYRYALKSGQDDWKMQLFKQWTSLGEYLGTADILRIDAEGIMFNMDIHRAVETFCQPDQDKGSVLEIIRCGYIYKGKIVRKADVVVNKIDTVSDKQNNFSKQRKRIWRSYNDSRNRSGYFNIRNRISKGRKTNSYRKP